MFYDDRLRTALDGPLPLGNTARAQYFQLVDILAQEFGTLAPDTLAAGMGRIHGLRAYVTDVERTRAVKALSGRLRNPALLQYLSADKPEIAGAAIAAARVSDDEMAMIVPNLSVRARGFLRARRDNGPKTLRALSSYGAADLVLTQDNEDIQRKELSAPYTGTVPASAGHISTADRKSKTGSIPKPEVGEREIGKIVARIEALRKSRSAQTMSQLSLGDDFLKDAARHPDRFGFETDDHGDIVWTDGEPFGAICGINISRPALDNTSGPDGYAAAAFRQRMPMEGARLQIRGSPLVAGSWRMDAQPYFDRLTGRFRGFRGQIRRPILGEEAAALRDAHRGDAVRQLIHELRTPLNAIQGFAEIIEQQLFGPAAYEYRSLAKEIMQDAHFMLSGFEDLDTVLKLDRKALEDETGQTSAAWLRMRIAERLSQQIVDDRNLEVNFADGFVGFGLAPATSERMILRLLSTLVSLIGSSETITTSFKPENGNDQAVMTVSLPENMRSLDEHRIFDPDFGAADSGGGQSLLGAGFSLRLVRNLATQAGGKLEVAPDSLHLTLPAIGHSAKEGQEAVAD